MKQTKQAALLLVTAFMLVFTSRTAVADGTTLELTDCSDNVVKIEPVTKGVIIQLGEGGVDKPWELINKIVLTCDPKYVPTPNSLNAPAQIFYKNGKTKTEVIKEFLYTGGLFGGNLEDGSQYKIGANSIKQIVVK